MSPRANVLVQDDGTKSTKGVAERVPGPGALKWLALVGLAWGAGAAAAERPVVAALPLDFARTHAWGPREAALSSGEGVLRRAYDEALAGQSQVAFTSKKEITAVLSALEDRDYVESDAELGKVAFAAGSLYALSVTVRLDAEGALEGDARVAREDGRSMANATARVAWEAGKARESARELFKQLFASLRLGQLPAALASVLPPAGELSAAEAHSTGGASPLLPVPASAPASTLSAESGQETRSSMLGAVGVAGLAVGCSALVAGALMTALAPLGQRDSLGHVIPSVELEAATRRLQIGGVVMMGGGLISAAVGVVALFVAGKPAPASAMFVPTAAGGALVLVGRL